MGASDDSGVQEISSSDEDEVGSALDGVVEFMQLRSGRTIGVKSAARPTQDNALLPGGLSLARIVERRARLPPPREEGEGLEASDHVQERPHPAAVPGAALSGTKSEEPSAGDADRSGSTGSTGSDSAMSNASYSRMPWRNVSRSTAPSTPSVCRPARHGVEGLPMQRSGLSDVSAMLSL